MERHRRFSDYGNDLLHDIRYTFRTLARDPGFAVVSVLILAWQSELTLRCSAW